MKKTLLVSLILLSGILFTACGKKNKEPTESVEPTEVIEISNCEKAVQKYLNWTEKKWEWIEVKAWDNIIVDYIWRLEDGTVFDTNIESIAKACGKYITWGNYTQWLSFEAKGGQLPKWFDEGVIWMKIWQTKTIQFWPEEWYWEYDKTKVEKFTSNDIWDLSQYKVWMMFQKSYYEIGTITSVTDKEMVVDFNHELAGKNLIFDITIKSIN